MARQTLICLAALFTAEGFAIAQAPGLRLEYIDGQRHNALRIEAQPIRVPSTDRISLNVVLDPLPVWATRLDGERLVIRAENNQVSSSPGNIPPANTSFTVRRRDGKETREVPFKVYTSGGGLGRLFVSLEIAGDPAMLRTKLGELFARSAALEQQEKRGNPSASSVVVDPQALAERFVQLAEGGVDIGFIYMTPGEYEITAAYTPRVGAALTSEPAHFVVFEAEYPTPAPRTPPN